jgi:hypothetical protein
MAFAESFISLSLALAFAKLTVVYRICRRQFVTGVFYWFSPMAIILKKPGVKSGCAF